MGSRKHFGKLQEVQGLPKPASYHAGKGDKAGDRGTDGAVCACGMTEDRLMTKGALSSNPGVGSTTLYIGRIISPREALSPMLAHEHT